MTLAHLDHSMRKWQVSSKGESALWTVDAAACPRFVHPIALGLLACLLLTNVTGAVAATHYVAKTGSHIGIRESRRIVGDYVLRERDLQRAAKFRDGIACCHRAFARNGKVEPGAAAVQEPLDHVVAAEADTGDLNRYIWMSC